MEFKGEILSHLLRIITPMVIAELTTASSGEKKTPLSDIITNYCDNPNDQYIESTQTINPDEDDLGQAKILPFDESPQDPQAKLVYQCGPRAHILLEDFKKLCKEMEDRVLGPKRLPKRKMSSYGEASNQVLEQKKKFEQSYAMLKTQEVLSLYKTVSKNSIVKDKSSVKDSKKENDKDFLADKEKGVLINKKQA